MPLARAVVKSVEMPLGSRERERESANKQQLPVLHHFIAGSACSGIGQECQDFRNLDRALPLPNPIIHTKKKTTGLQFANEMVLQNVDFP